MKYLLLASGGAAGTILRYFLVNTIQTGNSLFPWGTFSVNLTGSLIIGLIAGLLVNHDITDEWRLFIFAGILGGFTTFSSLAIETFYLLRAGNYFTGIMYMVSTNVAGLLLAILGFFTAKKILVLF